MRIDAHRTYTFSPIRARIKAKPVRRHKMIEQDTVRLLRECDAGAKMGVESIGSVLDRAEAPALHALLAASRTEHRKLGEEIRSALSDYAGEGKDPGAMGRFQLKS